MLDRLSENGAAVFRTDLNGTIVMASNGDMLHIFMERMRKIEKKLIIDRFEGTYAICEDQEKRCSLFR